MVGVAQLHGRKPNDARQFGGVGFVPNRRSALPQSVRRANSPENAAVSHLLFARDAVGIAYGDGAVGEVLREAGVGVSDGFAALGGGLPLLRLKRDPRRTHADEHVDAPAARLRVPAWRPTRAGLSSSASHTLRVCSCSLAIKFATPSSVRMRDRPFRHHAAAGLLGIYHTAYRAERAIVRAVMNSCVAALLEDANAHFQRKGAVGAKGFRGLAYRAYRIGLQSECAL